MSSNYVQSPEFSPGIRAMGIDLHIMVIKLRLQVLTGYVHNKGMHFNGFLL